jgi:hypothetical protein
MAGGAGNICPLWHHRLPERNSKRIFPMRRPNSPSTRPPPTAVPSACTAGKKEVGVPLSGTASGPTLGMAPPLSKESPIEVRVDPAVEFSRLGSAAGKA